MNLFDRRKNTVTAILNLFPEVRWDRLAGEVLTQFMVFGWIDRPDGKKDFILFIFNDGEVETYATSSATLSPQIGQRLGFGEGHNNCQRVEDVLPLVTNVIKLNP